MCVEELNPMALIREASDLPSASEIQPQCTLSTMIYSQVHFSSFFLSTYHQFIPRGPEPSPYCSPGGIISSFTWPFSVIYFCGTLAYILFYSYLSTRILFHSLKYQDLRESKVFLSFIPWIFSIVGGAGLWHWKDFKSSLSPDFWTPFISQL